MIKHVFQPYKVLLNNIFGGTRMFENIISAKKNKMIGMIQEWYLNAV